MGEPFGVCCEIYLLPYRWPFLFKFFSPLLYRWLFFKVVFLSFIIENVELCCLFSLILYGLYLWYVLCVFLIPYRWHFLGFFNGTINPGVTRKPGNPPMGIQNLFLHKPDNYLKRIQDLVPNGTRNHWRIGLTLKTKIDTNSSNKPVISLCLTVPSYSS